MTFRTDGDALIRRAEALENETGRLKKQLKVANEACDSDAKKLEKLESQLEEVRCERDKLAAAASEKARRNRESRRPSDLKSSRRVAYAALGGLVLIVVLVVLYVLWFVGAFR